MAKGAYIGVSGVARKVKKGYIGVGGVARKIKKAYIGVGGVARPCWSGGAPTYYGRLTDTYAYGSIATSQVGDSVIVAGGWFNEWSEYVQTVERYVKATLVKAGVGAMLPSATGNMFGGRVDNYALFGSGQNNNTATQTGVYAWDTSFVRTTATALPTSAMWGTAVSANNRMLYAGGGSSIYSSATMRNQVLVYAGNLVQSSLTALSTARSNSAGGVVGGHHVFCGGRTKHNYTTGTAACDVYNSSLVKGTIGDLSAASIFPSSGTTGKYILISGGTSDATSFMDAYNESLVKTSAPALSPARYGGGGGQLGDYAIFAGSGVYVDVYNDSLVRVEPVTAMSTAGARQSIESFGDYAIIFNRYNTPNTSGNSYATNTNYVEAYVIT